MIKLDIDQVQRKDIDELGVNTVSLAIDEMTSVNESFIDLLTVDIVANNWFSDDGSLSKQMISGDDKLVFTCSGENAWSYKDIVEVRLVGNIYSNDKISLESIGINQYFTSTDLSINESTNVDVAFDISEISQEDLNSLITDKGFDIVINFEGLKTNASVSIIELQAVFVFSDKLQGEKEAILNRIDLLNAIYPVGSIYMSANDVNPELLFGGVWEKIQNRFLLSSGSSYNLGATGGEATHTLTVGEMPSHNHTQASHKHTIDSLARYVATASARAGVGDELGDSTYNTSSIAPTINNTGGGQAHNNMPPYLVVNIWKRVS